MTEAEVLQEAFDRLKAFESANDICDFLRGQNIKGKTKDATSCAISEYMKAQGGANSTATGPDGGVYRSFDAFNDDDFNEHAELNWDEFSIYPNWTLTSPLGEFITKFDKGHYPELVADD